MEARSGHVGQGSGLGLLWEAKLSSENWNLQSRGRALKASEQGMNLVNVSLWDNYSHRWLHKEPKIGGLETKACGWGNHELNEEDGHHKKTVGKIWILDFSGGYKPWFRGSEADNCYCHYWKPYKSKKDISLSLTKNSWYIVDSQMFLQWIKGWTDQMSGWMRCLRKADYEGMAEIP